MKIKCEYCGNFLQDTEEKCPNCGAPNIKMVRSGIGVPKTIEELLSFCQQHKLPLKKMRFFIGEDYREPKAFGVYRDENGDLIVYKNKANGSRIERYRGNDEAYAVNEIYQKLKSEVQIRKDGSVVASKKKTPKRKSLLGLLKAGIGVVVVLAVLGVIGLLLVLFFKTPGDGYYNYHNDYYYCNDGSWYQYDQAQQGWDPISSAEPELTDNYTDYYKGSDYDGGGEVTDFTQSEYYSSTDEQDWNDDWDDDDFDWDTGSDWDSNDTDWDSDW